MLNAPAAERNKDPILNVLKGYLPKLDSNSGCEKVLEIASGTGQHVTHFATHIPHVIWHPSDIDQSHLTSISAHIQAKGLKNVVEPVFFDMMKSTTLSDNPCLEPKSFDLIYNANMVHISPWGTAEGLFYTAGKLLNSTGILVMYGPFKINGILTPESNIRFDQSLRSRDPSWGVRDTEDLKKLACENGLTYEKMIDMPSNNKCLIFRKAS